MEVQAKLSFTKIKIPPPCLFPSFLKILKPGIRISELDTWGDNQDPTAQTMSKLLAKHKTRNSSILFTILRAFK